MVAAAKTIGEADTGKAYVGARSTSEGDRGPVSAAEYPERGLGADLGREGITEWAGWPFPDDRSECSTRSAASAYSFRLDHAAEGVELATTAS